MCVQYIVYNLARRPDLQKASHLCTSCAAQRKRVKILMQGPMAPYALVDLEGRRAWHSPSLCRESKSCTAHQKHRGIWVPPCAPGGRLRHQTHLFDLLPSEDREVPPCCDQPWLPFAGAHHGRCQWRARVNVYAYTFARYSEYGPHHRGALDT